MIKTRPFAGFYGTDLAALILRIVFGAFFINHGWPKLERIFAGNLNFGDPIGLGEPTSLILVCAVEVIGGILLMLGLFTRWALIPMILQMLVIILFVHIGDPIAEHEIPVFYLAAFIALWIMGPGRISIDSRRK